MTIALGNRKTEIELPTKTGNKIATIIRKGVSLKERLTKLKKDKAENDAKIIPFAETHTDKTGMKSATFKAAEGEVTVKFGNRIKYDEADMPKIKKILGPTFSRCFHEIPSFAVNVEDIPEIREKLGADFDRLVQQRSTFKNTSELIDVLADGDSPSSVKLRDLVSIEDNKPSVSFNPVAK